MKTCVFGYDFPHRKTQDFLFHLYALGVTPDLVILAPKVCIKNRENKHKGNGKWALIHPESICENFGLNYMVCPHNSDEAIVAIKKLNLDIGIISGARILSKEVIDVFKKGVINFHPGKLPEARGLDAPLWSVMNDVPLGVSAHFIDDKIDKGRLIKFSEIKLVSSSNLIEIYECLYQKQLMMLGSVVETVSKNKAVFPSIEHAKLNTRMTEVEEKQAISNLKGYLEARYGEKNETIF